MKTKIINLYQFSELSEDAKQHAIEKLWDINVDYQWWEFTEDDAKRIGLNILEFDLDRSYFVKGEFINSAPETAEKIIQEHGKNCETYKTAKEFLNDLNELTSKSDNIEDVNEDDFKNLEDEFLKSLCEDYRIILTQEYEYQTTKESIIETIEANEYDFDEDGDLI